MIAQGGRFWTQSLEKWVQLIRLTLQWRQALSASLGGLVKAERHQEFWQVGELSETSEKGGRSMLRLQRGLRSISLRRPVLFGIVFGIVAGGLVILWPLFTAADSALARGLVVAVFLLSVGLPLLLLRSILRRRPFRRDEEGML